MQDFKGNFTIAREKIFLQKITFSNFDDLQLKVYYAIALIFSAKQFDNKEIVYVICEIININADFRIFVNASHSVFLKKL